MNYESYNLALFISDAKARQVWSDMVILGAGYREVLSLLAGLILIELIF